MSGNLLRFLAGCLLAFGGAGPVLASLPDWARAANAIPTPDHAAGAPAVVLVDEFVAEVDAKGMMTQTRRYAVRILHLAGKDEAIGTVNYDGASAKIDELTAWVVRNNKVLEEKGGGKWMDFSNEAAGAVVDENRRRVIDFSERVLAGDVFAFEARVREPMVVAQFSGSFGGILPKVRESLTLILPPKFDLHSVVDGPVVPELTHSDPRRWTWTVANQPYRPSESEEAGVGRTDARLFVQLKPPGDAGFAPARFESWPEVTAFSDRLNVPQCDSNAALVAKARTLAADSPDTLTTMRRIGADVQALRYIGINRGLRFGFGWRARRATEVFATGYGDCKDKANLMVSMLREVGIKAYLVIARVDRDWLVRGDFPTPTQFNHAIVAIPVGDEVNLPAVVTVGGLGQTLLFDPTDPYTLLGDLPAGIQGTSVFVLAPGVEGLVALPDIPAAVGFRLTRTLDLALAPSGGLVVAGTVSGAGQAGARLRAAFKFSTQPADLDKLILANLGSRLKNASIVEKKVVDDRAADRCQLAFSCAAPGYMQLTASANPVVRLDILSRSFVPNLTENQRRLPVELDPIEVQDDITLVLPPGFGVAEVPARVNLTSPYGRFGVEYLVEGDKVRMKRTLTFDRKVVPVEEYPKLKQFLADIVRSDRSSVLLNRKLAAQ